MAKVRDAAYRQNLTNIREMSPIFESHELQLFRKLEEVDYLIACISSEATTCCVSSDYCREYIRIHVTDMIDQIAEKREKEWKSKSRKAKRRTS
jgi:hypothetical protein